MPMPIRVELTHVDSERVVRTFGSTVKSRTVPGEAASVEEAEDRARCGCRLQQEVVMWTDFPPHGQASTSKGGCEAAIRL